MKQTTTDHIVYSLAFVAVAFAVYVFALTIADIVKELK